MPIPFILAGIAAFAGAAGVKKGFDAASDNKRASEITEDAQRIFNNEKREMERAKTTTTDCLNDYGKLKLYIWEKQFKRFVDDVKPIKNVKVEGKFTQDGTINSEEVNLNDMEDISLKASELVAGGAMALGSGALAGLATTGGVTMLASASTGTAIASLSGVAATNATLAWFGGGSLAAGGLGMAGGAAILGGIVAGPIIGVGGFIFAAKASENLEKARTAYSEAKNAVEKMKSICSVLNSITKITLQFTDIVTKLNNNFDNILKYIEMMILVHKDKYGYINYIDLNEPERKMIHIAYMFAQTIKKLLEVAIIKEDGSPDETSIENLLPAQKLLDYVE